MAEFSDRVADFDAYLRRNSIPLVGVINTNNTPEGLTLQFDASATAEQIAWANNAKETYDWRPRRLLDPETIASNFNGLTQAQKDSLLNHLVGITAQQAKSLLEDAIAVVGAPLPIDEVDPT